MPTPRGDVSGRGIQFAQVPLNQGSGGAYIDTGRWAGNALAGPPGGFNSMSGAASRPAIVRSLNKMKPTMPDALPALYQ